MNPSDTTRRGAAPRPLEDAGAHNRADADERGLPNGDVVLLHAHGRTSVRSSVVFCLSFGRRRLGVRSFGSGDSHRRQCATARIAQITTTALSSATTLLTSNPETKATYRAAPSSAAEA